MIKGATIMIHTHQTAPTQFVEANGIRFAYRRFGKTGGVPIVFNQHYIGSSVGNRGGEPVPHIEHLSEGYQTQGAL